jgi:hypothetical protein
MQKFTHSLTGQELTDTYSFNNMTNEQIIKKFLSGYTDCVNSTGSLFIIEDTLYSYGKHYPLAKRKENGIWVNSEKYSKTTLRQKSMVCKLVAKFGLTLIKD